MDLKELKRRNLLRLLEEKDLKQKDLAQRLGKRPSTISDIVNGKKGFGRKFEEELVREFRIPYNYLTTPLPGENKLGRVSEPMIQYETKADQVLKKVIKIMKSKNKLAIILLEGQIDLIFRNIKNKRID